MRSNQIAPTLMSLQEKRKNTMVEYGLIIAAFFAILLVIVAIAQAVGAHRVAHNATPQATSCALVRGAPRLV